MDKPTKSILSLTDAQIDEASETYAPIDEAVTIRIGNIEARLSGGQYLAPWKRFALTLMIESIDERPIYFASSGNAATSLGVQPYLVRQGLAFRLNNGTLSANGDHGFTRLLASPYSALTGEWLDVERTKTLLDEVFVHREGLPDSWDHWPDIATLGIPNYYSWVYMALVQEAIQRNDVEALDRYRARADAWSSLGT
jgi:hypothetical protein